MASPKTKKKGGVILIFKIEVFRMPRELETLLHRVRGRVVEIRPLGKSPYMRVIIETCEGLFITHLSKADLLPEAGAWPEWPIFWR